MSAAVVDEPLQSKAAEEIILDMLRALDISRGGGGMCESVAEKTDKSVDARFEEGSPWRAGG